MVILTEHATLLRQNIIIPNLFKSANKNYEDNKGNDDDDNDDNINIFNQGKTIS